jgi:hypothetical protein
MVQAPLNSLTSTLTRDWKQGTEKKIQNPKIGVKCQHEVLAVNQDGQSTRRFVQKEDAKRQTRRRQVALQLAIRPQ